MPCFRRKQGGGGRGKTCVIVIIKIPNGVMKNEIDYILTNMPDILIYIAVINQFNIGSDQYEHGERKISMNKSRYHINMSKEF